MKQTHNHKKNKQLKVSVKKYTLQNQNRSFQKEVRKNRIKSS